MKGIYALIIQVDKDTTINVGALGKLTLKKGVYAYVGSAQTNLEQRIKRHLKREKHPFWHIDYLLNSNAARVTEVLYKQATKAEECKIANVIREKGKPVNSFGSSDCNCKSHLFYIQNYLFLQKTMRRLHVKNITLFNGRQRRIRSSSLERS